MVGHLVAQIQQHREGKLGNGSGAVVGNIANRDAALFGSFAVHNIVTRCQNAYQLDVGAGVQNGFVNGRLIGQYNIRIPNALCHFFQRGALVYGDLTVLIQKIPAQIAGIHGMTV